MAENNDRCYNGSLTSASRLYIDRLWQGMGIDPHDDRAAVIEAHLIRDTLMSHKSALEHMRIEFNRKNK